MGVRESEGLFWGAAIYPGAALSGLPSCPCALRPAAEKSRWAASVQAPKHCSHCPPQSSSTSACKPTISTQRLGSREAEFEGSCWAYFVHDPLKRERDDKKGREGLTT